MSYVEDLNYRRLMVRSLVQTHFQEGWQFRLDIDDPATPEDFEIYVKDISFGPIEIETEPFKAGMQTLTFPTGTGAVGLAMTMRDNQDRRIYDWFAAWCGQMVNDDGTVNLISEYVKKVERVNLATDEVQDTWFMFPIRMGDITEAVDAEGFAEFPISFIQFRSWGE